MFYRGPEAIVSEVQEKGCCERLKVSIALFDHKYMSQGLIKEGKHKKTSQLISAEHENK